MSRLAGAGLLEAADVVDLGQVVVVPALVNAHCHLELSWMRGRVPASASMPQWAVRLMAERRAAGGDDLGPMSAAVAELVAAGTGAIADVSNTLASVGALGAAPVRAVVFHELVGFARPDPAGDVRTARARIAALPGAPNVDVMLGAHALYSVSPAMFRALAADLGEHPGARLSVHVAESREEMEFLMRGSGPWRDVLVGVGAWDADWRAPAADPVTCLDRLGLLGPRLLAVHAVHCDAPALARLADSGTTVVTCPRSNRWTGAGVPPVAAFYASGVRVALGTDSLASGADLNLFGELRTLRELAPGVPASQLVRSATLAGAEALGLASELGSLEPGKQARVISVDVGPAHDPEEALVSGVDPGRVRWLDRGPDSRQSGPGAMRPAAW
jgi:cytosine/adenosine deaminase-related metal-dependent hydrolase